MAEVCFNALTWRLVTTAVVVSLKVRVNSVLSTRNGDTLELYLEASKFSMTTVLVLGKDVPLAPVNGSTVGLVYFNAFTAVTGRVSSEVAVGLTLKFNGSIVIYFNGLVPTLFSGL